VRAFADLKGAPALIPHTAYRIPHTATMRAIICGPPQAGKSYFAALLLRGTDGCTLLLDDYKGAGELAAALGGATSWIVVVRRLDDLTPQEWGFADIVFEALAGGRHQFGAQLRREPRGG